jgi:hypothetical protein
MDARNNPGIGRDARTIVTTRVFNTPRELVFEAWTYPKHLVQWWGPAASTKSDRLRRDRETRTASLPPSRWRRCRASANPHNSDLRGSRRQNQTYHADGLLVGRGTRPGGRKVWRHRGRKTNSGTSRGTFGDDGLTGDSRETSKGKRRDENRRKDGRLREPRRARDRYHTHFRCATQSRLQGVDRSQAHGAVVGSKGLQKPDLRVGRAGRRRLAYRHALPRWHRLPCGGVYREIVEPDECRIEGLLTRKENRDDQLRRRFRGPCPRK